MRMAKIVEWERKARKRFPLSECFQLTRFPADDELAVTSLPQAARKLQQLALAAAQTQACIDMNDLQGPRGSHEWWPKAARRLASLAYFLRTYRAAMVAIRNPWRPSRTPRRKK
jgi:hypothetical protein